jgi:nitrous oxidase accessory protein NosD
MKKSLAVGIILLFVGTSIIPTNAQITEKTPPISRGDWLYVGGTGPGNYTRIQDAINDSTDGDTVFVYDDSSPYTEYIIINKSITLLGENKNTTILKGIAAIKQHIIRINADGVFFHGFTIQNSTYDLDASYDGIAIYSDNNDISGNIFIHNVGCILLSYASRNMIHDNIFTNGTGYCHAIRMAYGRYNEIYQNNISNVLWGVDSMGSAFTKIHGNRFSQIQSCEVSIEGTWSRNFTLCNQIFKNYFSGSEKGIQIAGCSLNFIYLNEITHCNYGLYRSLTYVTFIMENNLINNSYNAYFYDRGIMNKWSRNYWDDWNGSGFYTIHGETTNLMDWEGDPVPIEQYDKHPVQEPYDLGS